MPDVLSFNPSRALDANANGSAGAKAYFYDSGTTTLRTVYSDAACTIPHPSPLVADANGTFAAVFSSASSIKVVVTDSAGATLYTIDPCVRVAASGAAASTISFSPTVALPFDNVQAAIEGSVAAAASGYNAFGLGVTGSVALLANLDATATASGQYRFDGTTTGTYPSGVLAADTGAVSIVRETSGSAWMYLHHDTTNGLWFRRMNASSWGSWREVPTGATTVGKSLVTATDAAAGRTAITAGIQLGTSVASTSGTAIDFTSIPSGVRRVTVMFNGVSTTGTSPPLVQIGTSGGIVTSGYSCFGVHINNTGAVNISSTAGLLLFASLAATSSIVGQIRLENLTGNVWVAVGHLSRGDNNIVSQTNVVVSLAAALDRVRITTVGGTDTFDAGTINISWEF